MSKSLPHILLVFLLLIAIPFRGFAASSSAVCLPNTGHMNQTGSMADHHHSPEHIQDQQDQQHQIPPEISHPANTVQHSDDADTKNQCTHCAPCCLAVALNSHSTPAPILPASGTNFPALTETLHSALVRSLERPPQSRLR